jgi:hypothetical protein
MNRLVQFVAMTFIVSACGGGGGGDNGAGFVPAPAPEGANISLDLADIAGNEITEITPLRDGLFRVAVKAPNGDALPQEVVTAEVSIGRLVPESGTALTDDNGEALFIVKADGVDGAGTLTASMTYNDVDSSGSINFSVSTSLPFSLYPELVDAAGSSIAAASTGDKLTLKVLLTDDRFGVPLQNQVITADIGDLGTVTPSSGNAVTNAEGIAIFVISVGELSGSFPITVSATVPGGGITNSLSLIVDQAVRKLGHFDSEGNFVEGVIKISPTGKLSPGGTAALSLAVVDDNLEPSGTEENVDITSSCLFGNLATLDPTSPITMGNSITVDYTATGCSGEDLITATLVSSGAEASGVVEIASPSAERIVFDSATPEVIALRGTGSASDIAESSMVSFTVTDGEGNPVADARVNFSLVQTTGGLALDCQGSDYCSYASVEDQTQGRSNRDTTNTTPSGEASTRVLSGTVSTPVQVLAYVDLNNDGIQDLDEPASTSKTLVVSTGLPDQNSISLSATLLNVEGAYEVDGKVSNLTIRMADAFNNPVPDGTAAIFSTELGSVVGSCSTAGGLCSLDWTSQSPRNSATVEKFSAPITIYENLDASTPNRYSCPSHREQSGPCPDDIGDPAVNPPGAPRGGRSTILVHANGEESFVDRNANGRYDEGEFWTNLTEAFIDHNEDGLYTPTQRDNCLDPSAADDVCLAGFEETFIDRNSNGVFDLNNTPESSEGSSLPDGLYNGVLCGLEEDAAGICSRELVNVRDSLVLVNGFSDASSYDMVVIANDKREPSVLRGDSIYSIYTSDIFNNPPPPGTTLTFEGSGECEALNEVPPIPDTNRAGAYTASLVVDTNDYTLTPDEEASAPPNQITIKLTLPNGSFIQEVYACRVLGCDDVNFSPEPAICQSDSGT